MNLKRYKCGGCYEIIGPTNEYIKKCATCGSSLLEKQEISAEDLIKFIHDELEDANCHSQIDLPEKLFIRIKNYIPFNIDDEKALQLAQIIAEEFYNNM